MHSALSFQQLPVATHSSDPEYIECNRRPIIKCKGTNYDSTGYITLKCNSYTPLTGPRGTRRAKAQTERNVLMGCAGSVFIHISEVITASTIEMFDHSRFTHAEVTLKIL